VLFERVSRSIEEGFRGESLLSFCEEIEEMVKRQALQCIALLYSLVWTWGRIRVVS